MGVMFPNGTFSVLHPHQPGDNTITQLDTIARGFTPAQLDAALTRYGYLKPSSELKIHTIQQLRDNPKIMWMLIGMLQVKKSVQNPDSEPTYANLATVCKSTFNIIISSGLIQSWVQGRTLNIQTPPQEFERHFNRGQELARKYIIPTPSEEELNQLQRLAQQFYNPKLRSTKGSWSMFCKNHIVNNPEGFPVISQRDPDQIRYLFQKAVKQAPHT